MRRLGADKLLLCTLLALGGCVAGEVDDGSGGGRDRVDAIASIPKHPFIQTGCAAKVPGLMHCHSLIRTSDLQPNVPSFTATPDATAGGLGPSDIQSAYALNTSGGAGLTVAIVDAQDDPNAEKDLGTYRSQLRPAGVHHGERLLQEGEPERRGQPAAVGRQRLGRRDRARPRHGLGGLPELQDPPRRGDLGEHGRPRRGGEHGRVDGRGGGLATATAAARTRATRRRTRSTSTTRASASSRRRATAATASSIRRRRRT